MNAKNGSRGWAVAKRDFDAVAGHDFEAFWNGIVEDELRGAVDEYLGSGHQQGLGWKILRS